MANTEQQYDIAKIRQLLLAAFTPEELRRFCYDHHTFRPIVALFGPGHGLADMVDRVVEYCDRHVLLDQLLTDVSQLNHGQYARFFESELAVGPVVSPEDESELARKRIRILGIFFLSLVIVLILVVLSVRVIKSGREAANATERAAAFALISPSSSQTPAFTPTSTSKPIPSSTATHTSTPTPTNTPTSTHTPLPTPTVTPTSTPTPTPTSTPTSTYTPWPTPTPTPVPRIAILNLIESERQAVLSKDMALIQTIFTADATKGDAMTGQLWNAIQRYRQDFETQDHLKIKHANFQFNITGNTATVTNDSCGSLIDNSRPPGEQSITYSCVQCDKWTFERDNTGRWWITSFTYSLPPTAPLQKYTFEYGNNGCWDVRYYDGQAQGQEPRHTTEKAHGGQGSLRFAFELASLRTGRAQTIRYNMPFAGQALAYIYAPPDAPADLEAGFLAMELDHDPWDLHYAEEMVRLVPGQWKEIKWTVDSTGWKWPLHLFGIWVRRAGGGPYQGYILIDDVTIKSQ